MAAARVAGALALLVAGLSVVVPAPTYRAWLVSVALTEFGHLVAPAALAFLWPGFHRTNAGRVSALIGITAAACLLTPLVRALPVAQALPARMARAFGAGTRLPLAQSDTAPRARPIDPVQLFSGVAGPDLRAERLVYAWRGEQALTLNLYARQRGPDAPPAPIVLVIHGGGWRSGAPSDMHELARYFASRG